MPSGESYTIGRGDCIESIAKQKGFFAETIWNHAQNSELRELRKDPNTLLEGDVLFIPTLEAGEESGGTEARHKFRRKGVPARLRVKFTRPVPPEENAPAGAGSSTDESVYEEPERPAEADQHEPVANAPFSIDIDGIVTEGTSDADGMIDVPIPPDAHKAKITFFPGTEDALVYDMDLGELAPADTVVGVRKRLHNLGYRCMPNGEENDADLRDAIKRFQAAENLEVTGEPDDATKAKVKEAHGS